MNLQVKERGQSVGLYVHVPFCAATCDFCGFYQKKPRDNDFAHYLAGINAEWERYLSRGVPPVATIFWGGGTPGLLGPRELRRLGSMLTASGENLPHEWTVEMAPAFVTDRKLEVLREIGVTRISLGVQSFHSAALEALGRPHRVEQVYRAIERVKAAGFPNFNIDLIFAAPGQSEAEWEADLKAAMDLGPAHISTYCLTFEEDTALYLRLAQGRIVREEEREADFYEHAWRLMEEGGFRQYEISNFCREGAACLHNLHTWRMGEWIGLGPAAASQFGGQRYTNIPDLERWLQGIGNQAPEYVEVMTADRDLLAQDAMIFGLRMNEGIALEQWQERFERPPWWDQWRVQFESWAESGLLETEGFPGHLRLSLRGRLLADRIATELLATGV